jgi:uncharacterized protein YkwD
MNRLYALLLATTFAVPATAKVPSHFNGGLDPWVELEAEARRAAEPPPAKPAPARADPAHVEPAQPEPAPLLHAPSACAAQVEAPALPPPEADAEAEFVPDFDTAADPDVLAEPEPEPIRIPTPEPDFAELAQPEPEPELEPAPTQDALDTVIPLSQPNPRLLSEAIVEATNEAREHHGLPAVDGELRLHRAAAGHAHRMARLGFFSHRDPHAADRRTPTDRARSAGIANPHIAENIATALTLDLPADRSVYVIDADRALFSLEAGGPALAPRTYRMFGRHVVRRWLASPGHRRNLLSKEAVQMGAAAAPFKQGGGVPTLSAVQVFQWYQPVQAPE